jgi:hypothetical protein
MWVHIFIVSNNGHVCLQCYLVRQTRHHGNGDNLCHMHNVAVDLRLFGDDSQTRNVIKTYVDTKHGKQPYIKFPKGEPSVVQCCVERLLRPVLSETISNMHGPRIVTCVLLCPQVSRTSTLLLVTCTADMFLSTAQA